MTVEQNKQLMIGMIEALNSADWETRLPKFMPGDFEMFRASHIEFRQSFPDYHVDIESMVGEGDMLAIVVKVSGTYVKEYPYADLAGIPGSGKKLTWHEAHFSHIENGKISIVYFLVDNYGRLQQLGVMK